MSNMKCPFCRQELVRHWGMTEPALYCCDNPKCSRGGVATESAWQELIHTRKMLRIAVDAIETIKYSKYSDAINLRHKANKALIDIYKIKDQPALEKAKKIDYKGE